MHSLFVRIAGIQCAHCAATIEHALKSRLPVESMHVRRNVAQLNSKVPLDSADIIAVITEAGYTTKPQWIAEHRTIFPSQYAEAGIVLFAIVALYALLRRLFGFDLFSIIPTVDSSATLGMLFVTGLFTSLHCISMCGALSLGASAGDKAHENIRSALAKPLLYNSGRLLSYTALGGAAGFLGSIIALSAYMAAIILAAGAIIMLLLALSMLGVLNLRMPPIFAVRARSGSAFMAGLANGFMPCGALQAMQVYAISTGSVRSGMASMFLFCLGTTPLLLAFASAAALTTGAARARLGRISAVLLLLLSLGMLSRAATALGIALPSAAEDVLVAELQDGGFQTAEFDLDFSSYKNLQMRRGIPVRLVIHADEEHLTGCNNEIVCNKLGFSQKLAVGANIIEFTPEKTGTFVYSCWMNMIKNKIRVVD